MSIAQMKAPYGICLYKALVLLAVDEEMCPGKKKRFQGVILSARGVYKNWMGWERVRGRGRGGDEFEHLKLQAKSFYS